MKCQVLRENIFLQVKLDVESISSSAVKTANAVFNDCLDFGFKHKTFSSTAYDNYNRSSTVMNNIVLISIKKVDKDDNSTYRLKLSCPEFDIKESILYSDDGLWRIINENSKSSAYTFTLTFHVETISQIKFSALYDDEQLVDFKLKANDGEISFHKAVLAAVSPKFRAEVVKGTENSNYLEIPDTTANTLQDFKTCIYTEVLPDENLEELLLMASYLKIKWLEYKCIDKMMKDMTTKNALKSLEFALENKHMPLFLGIMDCVQSGVIKMGEIRKLYMQQ